MAARAQEIDPEIAAWLHDADDEVLECRGQGHDFERIRRSRTRRPLQNTRVERRDGGSQIEWTCPVCDTVRTRTVEPDGTLFPPVTYAYRYQPNYKGPAGVTRRMCFDETERRISEDLAASGRVPEARFAAS
jgi:hypothetical protein